jgi:RNA polymerase sigma-70 factor (ECF subfamily)
MTTQPLPAIDPRLGDQALAALVATGDEAAVRQLMRRFNQTLFRTARAILRDDAEAEDALQEAYLKAFRAMGTFRADAKLSTWLVRIVVNEALGRLRRTRRGAQVITLDGDIETTTEIAMARDEAQAQPQAQPEREAHRAEVRRIMERKIDDLPDAFRAVFVLRAVEEMSVEEIAASLDIPEATVRTRFFRARALLRESLAREMDMATDDAFAFAGARCDRITEAVVARLHEVFP